MRKTQWFGSALLPLPLPPGGQPSSPGSGGWRVAVEEGHQVSWPPPPSAPTWQQGVESPYEVKGIFPEEKESVTSRAGWRRDSPFPQNSGQQIFTKNLLNYLLNYPSEDLTNNPTVYKNDCFIRFSPMLSIKTVFHLCHIS